MRTIRWFLTLTILFLASLTLSSTKALVIGIGNYSDSTIEQLPGAIEDARAFAEALKRNGVEPKIKENLTLSQLNVELSKWAREGEEEDTLILYFAGHGYTLKDEPYLIPSDANSGYIREDPDKVAYNLAKGLKELSEDIVAKEVLIIIDACYSGSLIKGARPLQDPRISEFSIESLIKEKSYVFLLSSKSNETSGQMDEGRGHFTYYLLKGIEGEANRDKDDKITVKEVYDYLREEVRKATNNSQTPVMVGDREIVIAWDLSVLYDTLSAEISRLSREGKLEKEYWELYTKILSQKENEDSDLEKIVRDYLLKYLNHKDLKVLNDLTRLAKFETGVPLTDQQPQTQTKGNCLLKIIAGNELAKSGTVEIDGIMEGTLEQGVLVVDHLGVGTHKIVLEGEKINRLEEEITFNYDYGALEVELNAEIATAVIKIVTIPPNAKIWIDGRELSSRSPWQEAVEVGKVYDLEVLLEGYGRETRKVNVPKKGELIEQSITIPPYPSPDKPQLTHPANNSKDIPIGNITLKWESKESDLTYRVEFDGKTYTTTNKSYTVSANERGKTYSWKVTATNEWGKETSSDTYSFTTKGNSAPEITLLSPENGSTGVQPESITLKWTGKDSDGDEISYRVYFGETSSPTYVTTTKQSEYKVSNKEPGKKYYWRVEASDNYGGTTTSTVYSFTTKDNRAPNTPSNPSPSNNAMNQPLTVTLSWDCSDPDGDAITYDVYFGTSSNPTTKESAGSSSKAISKSGLSYNTTYYWKVIAKDSKGATTEGPVWRFTTQGNRAPNTPSNPSPSNNATNQPLTVTLSWDCSDPDGDTVTYDVYFGTSSNPTTKESAGSSSKAISKSGLSYNTTYYWKVIAKDSKGATTEGPVWRFTTQSNRAPNTPSNPSPSNNATNQPLTVTLSWECSDPDGDAVTYDVYFGTSSNPTAKASTNQSGKTLSKGNLSAGTIYYWKVVAKDSKGATTEGPVWRFTTQSNRVPNQPSSPNPYNYSTNNKTDLTLSWDCSDPDGDTVTYDVYFDTNTNPTTKVSSGQTGKSLNRTNLSYGTTYYWKVIAKDSKEATTEGPVWRFTTQSNRAPNTPSNPSPSNNATNQPLTVTLSWECSDPDGDAVTYDVYFGTSSNPTAKASTNQSGKTLSKGNLSAGTIYYWKVVAKDSKGATTEGPVWKFTTQSNRAPNIPSSQNPANNATNQPLTVTLSWDCSDPDGDAVTYDVYFGTDGNPPKVSTNQSGRTLNRTNLSYGTTYYWKVVAKDSKGAITEGPVWRFTTQSAPANLSYTPSSIVPQMILVEKGSFTMGDTWGDGWDNEKPTHKVTFTYDFYMGKYETTFDEYDAFCEATGRSKLGDEGWGRGSRPVKYVSWNDAIAYCNWLSEKEKLPKAYDSNGNFLDKDGRVTTDPSKVVGYRLPTEAEWEYAARGGNKSKGYKYAGSDAVDKVAWYTSNSGGKTQEVGKKAPNELGLYDMSGNVWEWCSDWWDSSYYSKSPTTNPYNSTAGSSRVFRGGSWVDDAWCVRVTVRNVYSRPFTCFNVGLRICRTVP